ncbi:MAG: hypothetical protein ACKV2O_03980 [Acidimicrobiales bacterium]
MDGKYTIEASGTLTFGCCGLTADAEWFTSDGWATYLDGGDANLDLFAVYGAPIGIPAPGPSGSQDVNWGSFSSDHKYKITVVGNGEPIGFYFHDSAYGDNSGSLSLNIKAVSKEDCKNSGWISLTDAAGRRFKNQGDCVSYFN